MTIWAFAKVSDSDARKLVYESIYNGKSRFGWGEKDEDNLKVKWNGKQGFLLGITKGDWIVHVNSPQWGKCTAVQVKDQYEYDQGLKCPWGMDFRHVIPVDPSTIVEFDRKDSNIIPTVNLNPRQRYHRVYAESDFLQSIENLKNNNVQLKKGERKEVYHLKEKTSNVFKQITKLIHQTHKGKELERLFASVFRKIPGVVEVIENGFGYKTDNGADLIITIQSSVSSLVFENKIVVQLKSFGGKHYDLTAIDQIKTAINYYEANAGIIITTAMKTEKLEEEIQKASESVGKPIDLIAGDDVAKFIISYAKDHVFKLDITT